MTKIAGSGSGSISQRHGSADPDPHQNVMDPEHWSFLALENKIRVVHMSWIDGVKVDRSIDRFGIIEIETSISGRAQHFSITSLQLQHYSITALHHLRITCFPFSSSAWLKILFSMVSSQPWKERHIIIFLFIIFLFPCIPMNR
jgi:hypothetical protein